MASAQFGEYAAYMTPGGIRFQHNKKMVSRKAVPPEVVDFLSKKLGVEEKPQAKHPMPTEEEKAKLRAESLQVPPELERTPEEMAEHRPPAPVEEPPVPVDPLTEADFELPPVTDEEVEAVAAAGVIPQGDMPGVNVQEHPTDRAARETREDMSEFMEKVSIHTAPLEDIAQALYDRFGIYTVYLGRLPVNDEVNPLTAEAFTKYHLGIAYQAAIKAQSQGLLRQDPENHRRALDRNREAESNFQTDTPPQTMRDAREQNSFHFRTSVAGQRTEPTSEIVHEKGADGKMYAVRRDIPEGEIGKNNGANQRYDKEEDQLIVEPAFGKKVIRPDW